MKESKIKFPKKGAGKRLRELYEKKREQSKASDELLDQLKSNLVDVKPIESQFEIGSRDIP